MITQLIALAGEIVTGIQGVSGVIHGRKRWDVDDRVRGDRHVNVISILTPDKLSKETMNPPCPKELRAGWVGGLARSGSTHGPKSDIWFVRIWRTVVHASGRRGIFHRGDRHGEEIHKFVPWSSSWGALGSVKELLDRILVGPQAPWFQRAKIVVFLCD